MSFYLFSFYVCRLFFYAYFNLDFKGIENIPKAGEGIILISNHQSYLDPIMMGLNVKGRKLYFMAKKELFKVPILAPIIKKLGAFPVQRGKRDPKVIEKAVNIVKNGEIIAMFPEGRRSKNGKLMRPKTGAVQIAIESGAHILPCAICYKGKHPRSKVLVEYGKPIHLNDIVKGELTSNDIKALSEKCWDRVAEIYKKQQEDLS